jgi:hypothetical protein
MISTSGKQWLATTEIPADKGSARPFDKLR